MKYLFAAIALFVATTLQAQIKELKGTIIGTTYSVDYNNNNAMSTTVNNKADAFDGDMGTFFASYDRSYTWLGLDLGKKHVIKRIAFAPRRDWPQRLTLGVFEGANNPDFTDAVPLHVIKREPANNVLTYANVNVTRGFRYVRYVGPNDVRCNVAELKFYGIEGEGDDSQFYSVTNLPTVSIHTVGAEEVTSKDYYLDGIINIISQEGKNFFSDSLEIKGRGNASWGFPKKPYRLKLYNKARLLGSPSQSKNWTLINNYGDKTLIRNCLAFQISRCLEMEYTPWCVLVDVIFNGEYKGTYQLCDKIDIRKGRVDITEMEPTDIRSPEVTGGYLFEVDGYAYDEKSMFISGRYQIPITIKEPDEDDIVPAQKNYLVTYFNRMENSLASALYDTPQYGYERYFDKASFLKHLIVGELSCNTDTYHSVYMYKDRNSDKIFTGPVWDFDLAFDNDTRIHPIEGRTDFLFRTGGTCVTGMREFADRIINSSLDDLSEIWSRARYDNGLTYNRFMEHVDSLTDIVGESQVLNFMRWPILNQLVHQNYQALGSYDAEVDVIRTFLNNRFPWMDNKIGLTPVSVDNAISEENAGIFAVPGGITVDSTIDGSTITVYDTSGLAVHEAEAAAGGSEISLQPGIYIVKVNNGAKVIRKKVLVK